jgi:hypothetical protein
MAQPPTAAPPAAAQPPGTVYDTEALRTGALPPELAQKITPLHSLAAIEDLLKQNRVSFAWGRAQMSASALPPELVKQIDSLPPGEVYMLKQGEGWIMGVVLSKH